MCNQSINYMLIFHFSKLFFPHRIVDHLGSGRFGTVDRGLWTTPQEQVAVAIKTLNGTSTEEEEVRFLQEAAINGQFNHPYIVKLFGVVTDEHPVSLSSIISNY